MKIAIAAPARFVTKKDMEFAIKWLDKNGFETVYDERLFSKDYIFAGSDDFRASVMQEYMDRDDIDVIWLARGGYGSIRIIDKLDFSVLEKHPKIFAGFSDGTVFHGKLNRLGIPTVHSPMPSYLDHKTSQSLKSLHDAFVGKPLCYSFPSHPLNRSGSATETIVGGNLSVLYGMMGSDSFPETDGKILFIEEVDEYIYHIERMLYGLKRAGMLSHLKALVIGGLTDIHDNPEPFGRTVEQVIADVVSEYDYPVCFGFPAGHFHDNRAFVLGLPAHLEMNENQSKIKFSPWQWQPSC